MLTAISDRDVRFFILLDPRTEATEASQYPVAKVTNRRGSRAYGRIDLQMGKRPPVAFNVKTIHVVNNLLKTLSPNVTRQINAAVKDMHQSMKTLHGMLPNLRSYHNTDIRRTCTNNGYGGFSTFMASLAEISRCRYEDENEEQPDGPGGEPATGSMGRGARDW